jgi:hypothetical protein
VLPRGLRRAAYLRIDYRHIVPIEKELQIDAEVDGWTVQSSCRAG